MQGVPVDELFGFIFEGLLDERAIKQIKECSSLLRGLFDASPDKRRTQRAILKGVASLVTAPKYGDVLLKKTPAILMTLYACCATPPHAHGSHLQYLDEAIGVLHRLISSIMRSLGSIPPLPTTTWTCGETYRGNLNRLGFFLDSFCPTEDGGVG